MMNNKLKPIIGILPNSSINEGGSCAGMELCNLLQDYVTAIEKAGGVPIVLPIVKEVALIKRQVELVAGILLTGGSDVNPIHYGEEPLPLLENITPNRDIFELEVIRQANLLQKPILGICRGLQILNVAFGGTLYQDLSYAPNTFVCHRQKAMRRELTHSISISNNTRLFDIVEQTTLLTNSFHHQAIKDLASPFIVSSRAKDDIIESIEIPGDRFVMAVQWHPESLYLTDNATRKLFSNFVQAARLTG